MTVNKSAIGLAKWCNQSQEYMPVATITPTYPNIKDSSFKIDKFPFFRGSLPIGLSGISKSSNIPPLLKEFLPQGFSSKLLTAAIPEWQSATDFEKLQIIGNREVGAYELFNLGYDHGSKPIIGEEERDKLTDKMVVLESRSELFKILDSGNFYALTTLGGDKAKFAFQDHLGSRFVVKLNFLVNKSLTHSANVLQGLLANVFEEAEGYGAAYQVVKTSQGNSALLAERYDYKVSGSGDDKQIFKYQVFNADSLSNISIANQMNFSNQTSNQLERLISIIDTNCQFPVYDRKELLRRFIFSTITNQTSFNFNSVNFIETNDSKFELARTLQSLPDRYANDDYPLHISGYTQQHHQTFDENHIDAISKVFKFPESVVENILSNCMKGLAALPAMAKMEGVSKNDYDLLTKNMIPPAVKKLMPKETFDMKTREIKPLEIKPTI